MCKLIVGSLVVVLVGVASAQATVTIPVSDPSYLQFGDMTTFNWRILAAEGAIPSIPDTPTGTNLPLVRMFSNGNPNASLNGAVAAPVDWVSNGDENPTQSAAAWWGLEYDKHTDLVTRLGTTNDILAAIQTLDPGSVNPIFSFDQNQTGSSPDIDLRGRLILLDPSINLLGDTAAQVNAIVDPLVTANSPLVKVLQLYDDAVNPPTFNIDPPGFTSGDFVPLPGMYTAGPYTVNNNIGGNKSDWGGFFPGFDLTQYPNWGFLVEVQSYLNNGGKEEAYIVGGVLRVGVPSDPIPEPLTATLGLVALASLYRRFVAYARA